VRLSTLSLQANEFDWNRGCLAFYYGGYAWAQSGPANNGNLTRQEHYAPADEGYSNYWYTQDSYNYDSLNRLGSTSELHGGPWGQSAQDYQQVYTYDRWGNRTINQSQTTPSIPHPNYTADSSTNRLIAPAGYNYGYDNAGNQTNDNYTGAGTRNYDAENRLTSAGTTGSPAAYTYDADGRRIKRNVNGVETWQAYGLDGELLAEYAAGAAPFLVSTEYGYRGGELLVTISSGDVQRLRRFVKNLYYNALARDPSANELQQQMDTLAQAGVQGEAQLLTTARSIARGLFQSSEYIARGRTDPQYVTDLYNAYLQRGPDTSGLNFWVSNTQANGRAATLNAFDVCTEFATLASTVYGTASGGDNQRVEHFVQQFYYGALQREPTSGEMQQQTQRLNNAAALGQSQVVAEAQAMGGEVFQATNYNSSHTTEQYVTDLYEAFLQRAPDGPGLNFWVNNTQANGRPATLAAFKVSTEYAELAGTLYREAFWLVADQLHTPRIIVNKSGALAGVKRHDYLPFGEELFAGTGGRTATQGYTVDSVRQKFTSKERDSETGLDFFEARYYGSTQGRFVSVDPGNFVPADPQSWNRFAYTQNNPLKFIDPTGKDLFILGPYANDLLAELERFTGLHLKRDVKTGKVTIDTSVKRNKKGTSTWLANKVAEVIGDVAAKVKVGTGRSQPGVFFDSSDLRQVDLDDYDALKKADPALAANSLGHVIEEYYRLETNPWLSPQSDRGRFLDAHEAALEFESNVQSDFTGWWEKPAQQRTLQVPGGAIATFEYSTVSYDVLLKSDATGSINVISVKKNETQKPRKY
jgi:RHS repeat-associated protein